VQEIAESTFSVAPKRTTRVDARHHESTVILDISDCDRETSKEIAPVEPATSRRGGKAAKKATNPCQNFGRPSGVTSPIGGAITPDSKLPILGGTGGIQRLAHPPGAGRHSKTKLPMLGWTAVPRDQTYYENGPLAVRAKRAYYSEQRNELGARREDYAQSPRTISSAPLSAARCTRVNFANAAPIRDSLACGRGRPATQLSGGRCCIHEHHTRTGGPRRVRQFETFPRNILPRIQLSWTTHSIGSFSYTPKNTAIGNSCAVAAGEANLYQRTRGLKWSRMSPP